jgi:HAE1 family hydrophobic/amphiphilic exporter-1
MALIVVYLVLAALYENLGDPLVILLSVPAALLGAAGLLLLRHITSDVYAQIGYVMLIGLSAKNAILIVEFAIQERATGKSPAEAVVAAAQARLRPILMTSLAFIAGLLPLVFASGAGAASRHSLGTAVVGGMLVSTVLNLIVVPAMYIIFDDLGASLRRVGRRLSGRSSAKPAVAGSEA